MFYKKYQQRLRLKNKMNITILHKNVSVEREDSYSKYQHTRSQKKTHGESHILLLKHIT